jgi:putative toxin-antitoxin system antitoxin component (TIGR02293 family)
MTHTDRLVLLLGGRSSLGPSLPTTVLALADRVSEGLPFKSFTNVVNELQVSELELNKYFHLAPRTLARRKTAHRLSAGESERLVRLARVATRAEEVLGSMNKARIWMRTANRALGGASPFERLANDLGLEAVLDLLGRIEDGAFS